MGLSPISNSDRVIITPVQNEPSRTYRFDFNTGEIGGMVDGEDAIRQFIRKTLVTPRYRFLIYDRSHGSELDSLIGQDVTQEFLEMELPRMIREALIYDNRIADVTDFEITRDGAKTYVSFLVLSVDGITISEGVTL